MREKQQPKWFFRIRLVVFFPTKACNNLVERYIGKTNYSKEVVKFTCGCIRNTMFFHGPWLLSTSTNSKESTLIKVSIKEKRGQVKSHIQTRNILIGLEGSKFKVSFGSWQVDLDIYCVVIHFKYSFIAYWCCNCHFAPILAGCCSLWLQYKDIVLS